MHSSPRKLVLLAVSSLVALGTVGATTAGAHGGPGHGSKGVSASALVTEAAKQLNVTRARLADAIVDAAVARIDAEAREDELTTSESADLKDEARENLGFAIAVSRTRTVASNLGIAVDRLNNGFRAARKALILARINEAVADGDLEAAEAAELKEDLEDADLPGYKQFGYGFGYGRGFGR